MVKSIPIQSEQDVKKFFQPSELKEMISSTGKFISAQNIVIENKPAGITISDMTLKRLDKVLLTRMTQFLIIHKNAMIFIQFSILKAPTQMESLDDLQNRFFPTFKAIANTLVLNDLY